MNANNPVAAQTQTALMSAILQSGSFPSLDPNNLQSMFCNPALAAMLQAFNLNGLLNQTNISNGDSNLNHIGNKNGEDVDNNSRLNGRKSPNDHTQHECANCGALGSMTQLKRYGSLSHYLCGRCANQRKSSDPTSSPHSGRKVSVTIIITSESNQFILFSNLNLAMFNAVIVVLHNPVNGDGMFVVKLFAMPVVFIINFIIGIDRFICVEILLPTVNELQM